MTAPRKAKGKAIPSSTRQGTTPPEPAPRKGKPSQDPSPVSKTAQSGMQLHTTEGARKYLTASERDSFLREAERGVPLPGP